MDTLNTELNAFPSTYTYVPFTQAAFDALPPYLTDLTFNQCSFFALDLSAARFEKCTFNNCDFSKCSATRANSPSVWSFHLCIFNNCDFSNANLSHITLQNTTFMGCSLVKANLANSYLFHCTIAACDLRQANLDYTHISPNTLIGFVGKPPNFRKIKRAFLALLKSAKEHAPALITLIKDNQIDGSLYMRDYGKCGCLKGSLASLRGFPLANHEMKPGSLLERFVATTRPDKANFTTPFLIEWSDEYLLTLEAKALTAWSDQYLLTLETKAPK